MPSAKQYFSGLAQQTQGAQAQGQNKQPYNPSTLSSTCPSCGQSPNAAGNPNDPNTMPLSTTMAGSGGSNGSLMAGDGEASCPDCGSSLTDSLGSLAGLV